jgi:hypothetical protein
MYVSKYDSVGSILFELVGVKSYVVVPEVSDQTSVGFRRVGVYRDGIICK